LGRILPDGCLEYFGRKDFQAKIRGFRIEPSEIEKILLEHEGVKEAVVVARDDRLEEKQLVAYVVAAQRPAPTMRELRNFLLRKLPDYMAPSSFVFLHALPLTPNGKVDRLALPAPDRQRPETEIAFVAPRKRVERALAQIWEKLLGLEHLGIHDNFFDLGGHSLLAARMFVEIQKAFGKKLPLSTLFQGATIEHLAGIIDKPTPLNPLPSLVAIQPLGSRPPFFCVHELFGDVFCYRKLAHYLGQDQPFYGLRARGLEGTDEPMSEINTMASHYIDEIRAIRPQGPYFLGGLSFGGVVAFEMACQLQAKGHVVAVVVLMDSVAPTSSDESPWRGKALPSLARGLPDWLIGLCQLTSDQWRELIQLKVKMASARLADIFGPPGHNELPHLIKQIGDLSEFPEQHRKVARVQYQAFREYKPQTYPGALTLFRARMQPLFSSHDPDKGWRRLAAGGVEVRVVPGNHLGMLKEPHVQVLAEHLRACLDRAQTQSATEPA
jgi:thioesterase domain-containing protein